MDRPAEPRLRPLTVALPADLLTVVVECAGIAHQTVDRFVEGVLRHEVARWEAAFAESLVGPAEDRQLAMAPTRVSEFVQKVRRALDGAAAGGDMPALVCSGGIRPQVRSIVERFRPSTPVLAQAEIHPRAQIRILGSI